jgi:rhamnopyranosyl-N-acetylglucosaminyl-diphospho-decaprenol beta-1,3/1,4-galactofuranosyltransferase
VKDKDLTAKTGRICAVVVTFNRKALLEGCLTALLNQTRRLDEIIVVDNASTDGTEDLVKARFPEVTYVKLPENIGGAGGFHQGMKLAFEKGHDWIWVMDDDAIPMADALGKLVNCPMILDDRVYALASTVLNRDGSISLLHRRLFDAKTLQGRAVKADKYEQDYFQMDTASFVGLLISRKAIRELGLPIKHFFLYWDDTEYSLRIRKRGIMLTVPCSKVVHGNGRLGSGQSTSRQQPLDWRWYYAIRNRIYVYKKHGDAGLVLYKWLFEKTYRDIKETLLFRHFKSRSMKIILCGVLDGLRGKLGKNTHFLPG